MMADLSRRTPEECYVPAQTFVAIAVLANKDADRASAKFDLSKINHVH
jgi:hypothetical protein